MYFGIENRFIKVINPYTGQRIQTLIGHGKLNEVRFWDFERLLKWSEEKETMETGNLLELPWEEQPKPEKKPAPRAVMSEEQMQAVEAAWKKKWSREEASISGSTPKSTPTKSARMKMTMARKSAPTTGGVKPEANDSPASFR